jgi:hypothetical protein
MRLLFPMMLAACAGSPPLAESDPPEATEPPTPVATPEPLEAPAPSSACLMVNVCGCNLGCAGVDVPSGGLTQGFVTTVVRGTLVGERVRVVEVVDASGTTVLALTDLDHDHACSLAPSRQFLGYGCAAADAGPVPAHACRAGC